MPIYDFVGKCGLAFEGVVAVGTQATPCRCKKKRCIASRDEIVRLRGHSNRFAVDAAPFKAPVVFRAKDGTYRFPGSTNSKETKRLERMGMERIELNTTSKIRRFERQMNAMENTKHQQFIAGQNAVFYAKQKESRDAMRAAIATGRMVMVDSEKGSKTYGRKYVGEVSEMQKDIMRQAMEHTDRTRPTGKGFDAGFNIQAFSYDSSNREEHRDVSTGWRGRKY